MITPLGFLMIVLIAFGACSHTTGLTSVKAGMMARELANQRASTLYGARPFRTDSPARWENGKWIWEDRQACGRGDMEAAIVLAPDGKEESIKILLLDSRPARSVYF